MEAVPVPTPVVAPPVPLHHQLRAHTAAAHARVDGGLGGSLRNARDYIAYLEGMAEFIDAAIAVIGAEPWLAEARHGIADDLGRAPGAARLGADDALADPARVVGWRYVVAGATLGARLLLRDARALEGGAHRAGTAFLSTFAGGDAWPRCLAALRDAGFDAAARARACDAALEAFHAAEAALSRARSQLHAA
jgi:heme oxygenase